jgi:hypothetical protein
VEGNVEAQAIEALDAEGGAKLLRSIVMVTHCVEDLDVAREGWSEILGFSVVESGVVGAVHAAAWRAPAAQGSRYCVLQPASGDDCWIRFVETGERGHAPPATWGWSATELLATDVDGLARRIEGTAFTRLGGPGDLYPRENAPRAMQVIGPSGELVYFTRLLPGGSRYGLKQAKSDVDRPFIVTVGGPSSATMHAYYGGTLGLRVMDRTPFMNGILAMLCQSPPGTVFPTAVARIPGRRFLLEMDEYPAHVGPRTVRDGHLPPGMSMVSFAVRDLGDFEALGLRAPPRALEGIGYDGRRVAVVEGAVGEWLELIEERT